MKVQNDPKDAPTSHILLIQQNRAGSAARTTVLQEAGYIVTAVATPHEGIERFTTIRFDLVITDYRMPQMMGDVLIKELRAVRNDVPVILISSVAAVLGLTEASTGADAVIVKNNFEVPSLLRAVTRLLRKKLEKKPVRSQGGPAKNDKTKNA